MDLRNFWSSEARKVRRLQRQAQAAGLAKNEPERTRLLAEIGRIVNPKPIPGVFRRFDQMTRQRVRHAARARWYENITAHPGMPRRERRKLARAYASGEIRMARQVTAGE